MVTFVIKNIFIIFIGYYGVFFLAYLINVLSTLSILGLPAAISAAFFSGCLVNWFHEKKCRTVLSNKQIYYAMLSGLIAFVIAGAFEWYINFIYGDVIPLLLALLVILVEEIFLFLAVAMTRNKFF